MRIKITELFLLFVNAICRRGFPTEQATKLAQWLLWATLRGNVQDGKKVPSLVYKSAGEIEVCRLSPTCALVKAHLNHPVIVLEHAIAIGMQIAREVGTALVGVTQTDQSSGAIGYFTNMVAEQGMIAELMSSTVPLVAPYDAAERLIGSNPYSAAFPGNPPVVIDASVAALSFYGVRAAETKGESLPEGVALDIAGEPTTDPRRVTFKEGTLLSQGVFASSVGVAIQLLASEMLGEESWGHLLRVTDPAMFGVRPDFAQRLRQKFKTTRSRSGSEGNSLPGERAHAAMLRAESSGEVEIPISLYESLTSMT